MKRLPNILSVIRIILAVVFIVLYLQNEIIWRALSITVFAVAGVTDFFDGYIARHYSAQSEYGVFLDPLADKVLTFSGFACLPFLDSSIFPWLAIAIIFARDIFVTLLRVVAGRKKYSMQTRFSAKIKTFSQMVFLYAVLLMGLFAQSSIKLGATCRQWLHSPGMGIIMWLVVAITVYTGLEYLWVNRKMFQQNASWTGLKQS